MGVTIDDMSDYLTTKDLRSLLKNGGELILGRDAVVKLAANELGKEQPDLQWLYDCAMEVGNSAGYFRGDSPPLLCFAQAGTCTLGIVCRVAFRCSDVPWQAMTKARDGATLYPEDVAGVEPVSVKIWYDAFHDEEDAE